MSAVLIMMQILLLLPVMRCIYHEYVTRMRGDAASPCALWRPELEVVALLHRLGFVESDITKWMCWVCEEDDLESVQLVVRRFVVTADDVRMRDNQVLRRCCECGRLEIAKWLVDRFDLTVDDACADNDALISACERGDLEVAQWLAERFALTNDGIDDAMSLACEMGHLEIVQWLVDQFDLTADDIRIDDNWILRCACVDENLPIAQWLVDRFALTADDAMAVLDTPCEEGNMRVAWWLCDRFGLRAPTMVYGGDKLSGAAMTKAAGRHRRVP